MQMLKDDSHELRVWLLQTVTCLQSKKFYNFPHRNILLQQTQLAWMSLKCYSICPLLTYLHESSRCNEIIMMYNTKSWIDQLVRSENNNLRGSITVWLTSCLFCLDTLLLLNYYLFSSIQNSQIKGQPYSDFSPYGECSLVIRTSHTFRNKGGYRFNSVLFICHNFI